jgi:hypothetical protein
MVVSAQLFTFGAIGGAPAQTPLGKSNDMPFVVGPTVTIRAVSRLSVETGLLYYRLGEREDNYAFQYPENTFTLIWEHQRGKTIELPFLAKYAILNENRRWQPFVSAGPAVRRTWTDSSRFTSVLSGGPMNNSGIEPRVDSESVKWKVDPVVGVGVTLRAGRLHMEPQVRYSYWGAGKNSNVLKNQVHILLGFRF